LLHFHLGSQITNIRQIKAAVIEAARIYVELKRAGAGLKYLDVGGAWASITTDRRPISSRASITRSRNYANDVVYHIQNVCDEAEVPHPIIVSESGRPSPLITACWCSTSWGHGFGDDSFEPYLRMPSSL